jgi:hypothetical protein
MQACGLEADIACGQTLWSAEFLQDSSQLLLLKGAAANVQTRQQLSTWRASVPPCTNSTSNGSCVLCDGSTPEDMCGTVSASDGAQLCNWRYVGCRDRRVVTLNMADQVIRMTAKLCTASIAAYPAVRQLCMEQLPHVRHSTNNCIQRVKLPACKDPSYGKLNALSTFVYDHDGQALKHSGLGLCRSATGLAGSCWCLLSKKHRSNLELATCNWPAQ